MEKTNLAGRAGRWSAAHWKTAFFGWLAFVAAAIFLGTAVGLNPLLDSNSGDGESGRAEKILAGADFKQPAGEQVIIQNQKLVATDPAFKAAIEDVAARVAKAPDVTAVVSPFDIATKSEGQISQDQHSAIVRFDLKGKPEDADDHVQGSLDATAAAQKANPGFYIGQFGDGSGEKALPSNSSGSSFLAAMPTEPVLAMKAA